MGCAAEKTAIARHRATPAGRRLVGAGRASREVSASWRVGGARVPAGSFNSPSPTLYRDASLGRRAPSAIRLFASQSEKQPKPFMVCMLRYTLYHETRQFHED